MGLPRGDPGRKGVPWKGCTWRGEGSKEEEPPGWRARGAALVSSVLGCAGAPLVRRDERRGKRGRRASWEGRGVPWTGGGEERSAHGEKTPPEHLPGKRSGTEESLWREARAGQKVALQPHYGEKRSVR